MCNVILLFRLKSGDFSKQDCQTIPRKINIFIYFADFFGLNKFIKISLNNLIMKKIFRSVATN